MVGSLKNLFKNIFQYNAYKWINKKLFIFFTFHPLFLSPSNFHFPSSSKIYFPPYVSELLSQISIILPLSRLLLCVSVFSQWSLTSFFKIRRLSVYCDGLDFLCSQTLTIYPALIYVWPTPADFSCLDSLSLVGGASQTRKWRRRWDCTRSRVCKGL